MLREKQYLPLPKDAIHVGLDPGIINPIDLAWRLEEHCPVQRMTYTAKEHYEAGHINSVAKKREARVQRLAKEQVDALSKTRKKTGDLDEFRAVRPSLDLI